MPFIGKMISYLLAMFFMIKSTLGALIPRKNGEDLRVSAYLIAPDAETVENMDVSHLKDITDLILIASPASFNAAGEIVLGDGFDGIIEALCEKTKGFDIKLHLTLGGPGGVEGDTWEEQMDSQSEQHRLAFDSGVLEENIKSLSITTRWTAFPSTMNTRSPSREERSTAISSSPSKKSSATLTSSAARSRHGAPIFPKRRNAPSTGWS